MLVFSCYAAEKLNKPEMSGHVLRGDVFVVSDFDLFDINTETVISRSRNIEAVVSSHLNSGFSALPNPEVLIQPQTPQILKIYSFVKQLSPESPVKTLFLSLPDSNAFIQLKIELEDGWINANILSVENVP